jgi:arabinogalactan oligomer/maltooligosaccharide transport system substrate-binding protein
MTVRTLSITLTLLLVLAACGSATPTPSIAPSIASPTAPLTAPAPTPGTSEAPGRVKTPAAAKTPVANPPIAFLLASLDDQASQRVRDLFIQTAESLTATVSFNQADNDAAKQKAQVANALSQGAQVLVIQPVDGAAAVAYVDAAHKAGARVIAFDRLIKTRDLDAYVAHDNFHAGQLEAGEALRWLNANKVKTPWNFVLLEGAAGDGIAAETTRGYYDVLKTPIDKKQVVVTADQAHSAWSSPQALKTTQDALTKTNNNLEAILANNSAMAQGALQALDQQKLVGKVFVAGAGAEVESIRDLCASREMLAVVKDIKPLAIAAAQLAVALANGQSVADTKMAQATIAVADRQVPLVSLAVQGVTSDTVQAALVQTGYYTPDQIGKCVPPLPEGATVPQVSAQGTLVLWTQEDDRVYPYIANLAAQFGAANHGAQIKLVNYDADTLRAKFTSPTPADTAPDLLWTTNDQASTFALADLLQPTDNLIDASQFLTITNAMVTVNGKRYGVPISVNRFLTLYYNTKLLKLAPADTDALVKLAATLSRSDGSQWALVYDQTDPVWLIPWLGAFKGQVFADDGKTPTLNTTAMVDALTFLKSLKDKKVVPPDSDSDAADTLFKQGKAAMMINRDGALGDYAAALGDNLGVARLPRVPKTGEFPHPYASSKFLFFSKSLSGDKLALARAFAQFVTSRAIELEMTLKFKRLPALKEALSDSSIANDPVLKALADQVLVSAALPTNPEMGCNWDNLKPNLQAVLGGKATPADAAKAMQDGAEACIAKLP